ncbi:hypothetical protein EJB05_48333, partial [Eragrostis curvula]
MEGPRDDGAVRNAAASGSACGEVGLQDQEWRRELAAAWGQSHAERSALRSQYAGVRTMIREVKDDPCLGQFDAAMGKIERLHEEVQRPMEQVVDGEALFDLASALAKAAISENRDGPTPSEFVTALLQNFGPRTSPLDDSNEPFSWSDLGALVSPMFVTATGCQTMLGPMGLSVRERKHAARKQSERLGRKPAEVDELAPDQDERNDTDENIAVMFGHLRTHRRAKLENLILNRQSFAQTVENLFALSFLVKDGRAEITVDDKGDHVVMPRNAPVAGQITSREVCTSQFVFRFDFRDWQMMKGVVEPGTELMPHRNSQQHGDEHENTTPCPARDCSQQGSGSHQLEEEEEFTDQEASEPAKENAMEENLPGCSSGLKKRKRSGVARRLFSAVPDPVGVGGSDNSVADSPRRGVRAKLPSVRVSGSEWI